MAGIAPYRFFFSYSWKNRGRPLQRFFNDLASEVRNHVGGELDAIAFRDRVSMKAGSEWPEGLLDAVKTSQVLVYLLSIDYIQSDYCGKELQAFLERIRSFKAANPNGPFPLFLQPVIWVPVSGTLPQVLGAIQPEDDEFPLEYSTKGLESLAKLKDKTAYNRCVETIAKRIIQAGVGNHLPILGQYERMADIPNAFTATGRVNEMPGGPTEVRCVYVAGNAEEVSTLRAVANELDRSDTSCYGEAGWYWQPFNPPVPATIGSIVQQMLTDFRYREVSLSNDHDKVLNELRNAADRDEIVLLIVDAWSAFLSRYETFLKGFDTSVPSSKSAVLVPWNECHEQTQTLRAMLEAQIRVVFQNKFPGNQAIPLFKPRINSLDEFRSVVRAVLEMIRSDIETRRAAKLHLPGRPLDQLGASNQNPNASR
jgi:FxsC-like protein